MRDVDLIAHVVVTFFKWAIPLAALAAVAFWLFSDPH